MPDAWRDAGDIVAYWDKALMEHQQAQLVADQVI